MDAETEQEFFKLVNRIDSLEAKNKILEMVCDHLMVNPDFAEKFVKLTAEL